MLSPQEKNLIRQLQERNEIRQRMKANQHELIALSLEAFEAHVQPEWDRQPEYVRRSWRRIKGMAELGASYYASADDIFTLSKLIGDLGGFTAKAYVKNYGGKPHIILKGRPGLRKILTGTKYGVKNPKVISLGLGKAGAINAVKSGGILTIVLMTAYRVVDYLLRDEATLTQLIGSLAMDVVKVGIAVGFSLAVMTSFTAFGVTLAIGPLMIVIVAGLLASLALTLLDDHYGITEKVVFGLDSLENMASHSVSAISNRVISKIRKSTNSSVDYFIESARQVIIDIGRCTLERLLRNVPRV